MKKILYTALLICSISPAFAQDKKNELSLTLGGSTPVGDFGSTDLSVARAGMAKSGGNFRLNYQHNFNPHFGVVIMLGGTSNEIDATNIQNLTSPPLKSETRYWSIVGFQVGGVYRIPVSEKFVVEARATVGVNTITFGGLYFTDNAGNTLEVTETKSKGFVYSLGVGGKYFATNRIFIPFHVDFLGCEANFSGVETKRNGVLQGTSSFDRPINNFNYSVGIGVTF